MDIRVLGTIEADGALPRRRLARVLLGMFCLRPNVSVSTEWLITGLWHGCPPASAAANLRSYVTELRRLLTDNAVRCTGGRYALLVTEAELDLLRFQRLAADGRQALTEGRCTEAADLLTRAGQLWRGPLLDGTTIPDVVADAASTLEDLRLAVLEDGVEARLALGAHAELAVELAGLTTTHPLRETLWQQRMRALYAIGRRTEALGVFAELAGALDAELGVPPSPASAALYQRMLAADPSLALVRPASRLPRQLPAAPTGFLGRTTELATLDGSAGIVVLSGEPGVGKTALAVHWAHRATDRFPDGCLYVDLQGFSAHPPLLPEQALAGFRHGLGLPADSDLADFRTALTGRRMLVLLDNARDVRQVRPLLPGEPGCLVVVTSRSALSGLVARDGAHRITLDPLPLPDAVALLRARLATDVDTEPAELIARQCAGLPLALRVAGELGAGRRSVAELVAATGQLDGFEVAGDQETALRTVFSWSYATLPAPAARAFRLLGLHRGPDLAADAADALLGEPAARVLAELAAAHLVRRINGRWAMPALLRAYAAELVTDDDRAGLARLLTHYRRRATAAMAVLYPEAGRVSRLTPRAARAWLDAELANLVAVIGQASELGRPADAVELAGTIAPDLLARGRYPESLAVHEHARRAGRRQGDRDAEATAHFQLGATCYRLERAPEAVRHLNSALRIRQVLGQRRQQAPILNLLACVTGEPGDGQPGESQLTRRYLVHALRLLRQTGDRAGEADTLRELAAIHYRLGRYGRAIRLFERSVSIYRELGEPAGEGRALGPLAAAHLRLGHYRLAREQGELGLLITGRSTDLASRWRATRVLGAVLLALGYRRQAAALLTEALAGYRELDDRAGAAGTLTLLAGLDRVAGNSTAALAKLGSALELADRWFRAAALNELGATLAGVGRTGEALHRHEAALALAGRTGDRYEHARAVEGVGHCLGRAGRVDESAARLAEALAGYTELGVPEADRLRARQAHR